MKRFNISETEALAYESPESPRISVGSGVMSIDRSDGDSSKQSVLRDYACLICDAMEIFFECGYFTERNDWKKNVKITIYGIAANAVTAGMSFAVVYNQSSREARRGYGCIHSFYLGAAMELNAKASREKRVERFLAKQAEHWCSDETKTNDEVKTDYDENEEPRWRSSTALTLYRANATRCREQYLLDQNIKLSYSRMRKHQYSDTYSFEEGKRYGRTINLRANRFAIM